MEFIINEPIKKTKGLNFMEAVQAMKEGKKVTRKVWSGESFINYVYLKFGSYTTSDETERTFYLTDFEATDWEIVDDDKDWNLAEQRTSAMITSPNFKDISNIHKMLDSINGNIKKCRDLILKDLSDECANDYQLLGTPKKIATDIVNKRFGDL